MNAKANPSLEVHPQAPVFQRTLGDVEDYVRREPVKAAAAAFGAGFLLSFIPPRVIVGAVTAVAGPFMRPILLALGLLKVCEVCAPEIKGNLSRMDG